MSAKLAKTSGQHGASRVRQLVWLAIGAVVLVAASMGTKVVPIEQVKSDVFSPAEYGKKDFPRIQGLIEKAAVDAKELAAAIAARNVAKSYGSVHALKGVNFDIHRGQVTTLFGENGAGKSTLMKILRRGPADLGEIILDGEPVAFASSSQCARPRHLDHPPGAQPRAEHERARQHLHGPRDHDRDGRRLRRGRAPDRKLMEELEEDIDPLTPVEDLRLGQQQIVEIARRLSVNSAAS
jgi:ABC-type glutathione transport system ATPase component